MVVATNDPGRYGSVGSRLVYNTRISLYGSHLQVRIFTMVTVNALYQLVVRMSNSLNFVDPLENAAGKIRQTFWVFCQFADFPEVEILHVFA